MNLLELCEEVFLRKQLIKGMSTSVWYLHRDWTQNIWTRTNYRLLIILSCSPFRPETLLESVNTPTARSSQTL